MRASLSLVAMVAASCSSGLPFGAPCDRDADCADEFVCDDDEDVCVPERDGDEGEGEGNEGEGEGEGIEGEGEEGEGEAGEGEGEGEANGDVIDVSGPLTLLSGVAMDARGDYVAVAAAHEVDPIGGTQRLDLFRVRVGGGSLAPVTVVDDIGRGGQSFLSLAVDADEVAWIAYNETGPSDVTMKIVGVNNAGEIVSGPHVLAGPNGGVAPRSDVAIGPSGQGAVVAFKDATGSFSIAREPSFTPELVDAGGFTEQELRRIALALDGGGRAHVLWAVPNGGIAHGYEDTVGGGFTVQTVADASGGTSTYMTAAFDEAGTLHAVFDFQPLSDSFDCHVEWDGSDWTACDPLPLDFNSHSHALLASPGQPLLLAYYDASAEAPTLLQIGQSAGVAVDDTPLGGGLTNIARLASGAVVVSYYAAGSDDDSDEARIALVE